MRPRTLLATAALALAAALGVAVALFPLSLALSLGGAPVEGEPRGRVWDGVIEDARAGGLELGTLRIRPKLLPLLTGSLSGTVEVDGPVGTGTGRLTARGQTLRLHAYDGTVSLAALGARDAFGQPLEGTAEVAARDVLTEDGACQAGTLAVTTNTLVLTARRLGGLLDAPVLSGQGACNAGVLDLPLSGRGPDGAATAHLRVAGRRYTTELTLMPSDPAAGRALAAYGFQRTPNGYSVITRGTF